MSQSKLERLKKLDDIRSQLNETLIEFHDFSNRSFDLYNEAIQDEIMTPEVKAVLFEIVKNSQKKVEEVEKNLKDIEEMVVQIISE